MESVMIMVLVIHLLALPIKVLSVLALCQAKYNFVL